MSTKRHNVIARIVLSILLCLVLLTAACSSSTRNSFSSKPVAVEQNQEDTARKEAEEKAKAEEQARIEAEEQARKEEEEKTAKYYEEVLSRLDDARPELKRVSFDFIVDNDSLFPAKTDDDKSKLNDLVDSSVQYKHLEKSFGAYLNTFIKVTGSIVFIEEDTLNGRPNQTYIHLLNEDGNSFEIFYDGSVDVFKGDRIKCIGLPVAMNSFSNIGGGITNTAVLIGSTVTKVK